MASRAFHDMAWSADPLVREIHSEVDDRPPEEIADSIYGMFLGVEDPSGEGWIEPPEGRSFQEPRATKHLTKKQASAATFMADNILGWAIYAVDYRDYSNPPWENAENPTFGTRGCWRILALGGRRDPRKFTSSHSAGAYANEKYGAGNWTLEWETKKPRKRKNPKGTKRVTNVRSLVAKALK